MRKQGKATVRDVAKLAGVSNATVSRAFNHSGIVNEDTYSKIMDAAAELNYEIPVSSGTNAPMKSGNLNIAVDCQNYNHDKHLILVNIPAISNPFYSEIIKGIQSSALNNQFEFLLYAGMIRENAMDDFLNLAHAVHAHGLITLNYIPDYLLEKITNHMPVVQCCEYTENNFASSVGIDDYAATQNGMEYFLSTGKTKIGFINGPLTYRFSQNRRKAYYAIMESAGIEVPDNWVIQLPDLNPDMAFSSVVKLLSTPNAPDCFFAVSDELAAAVIRAAQYCNYKVPNNILVIGFDNTTISQLTTPSITTINQPKFQLGFLACELLFEKIKNPLSEVKHMKLSTELIIRESTTSSM